MATARLQYDDTSTVRNIRSHITVVSNRKDVIVETASTDAALLDFPKELKMSQRDFKLFLVALESDEEPSDKLKALFED
jgi:uncharacterized protein (DUF1778 family)